MTYKPTAEQFLKDVSDHQMRIVRDDGKFRFIRFRCPDSLSYHFDLVTWPGCLCIAGDMGTDVFSRVADMFTFFRDDHGRINPPYWGEKLLTISKYGGYEEYSKDCFIEAVTSDFNDHFDELGDEAERAACWEEVEDRVLRFAADKYQAVEAALGFNRNGFRFQDFCEHNLNEYTYHYIWRLRAIVWGIAKYDEITEGKEA